MEIASISIGTGLDVTGAMADLKRFAEHPKIRNAKVSLQVMVIDKALTDLNRHLDLKQKHLQETVTFFNRNPIVVKTDDRSLTGLNRSLDATLIKLNSVESAIEQIKLKGSDLRVNIKETRTSAKIESRQEKNNEKFLKDLEKSITRSIKESSKESLLKRVLTAPLHIAGALATGALEGIGKSLTGKFGSGLFKAIETKSGIDSFDLGRKFGRQGYNRVKGLGQMAASVAGYDGGWKGVKSDINALGKTIDDFLSPKKLQKKIKTFEDTLVSILEDAFVFNRPDQAKKRAIEYISPSMERAKEGGLRMAGAAMRVGAQPLRIRKRVLLGRSAQQAADMAEGIDISELEQAKIEQAKSIALITGGIDFQEGGVNTEFAERLVKRVMPGAYSKRVYNPYSNDPKNLGKVYEIRKSIAKLMGQDDVDPMPLDRLLQIAVEKGYNPDAISMAAEAMAHRQKFPDKPINLLGTSGGSYVVEEAIAILERAGIKGVKGAGLTAPMAGLMATASRKNFRANVGDLDPLYLAMFGGKYVSGDPETDFALRKTLEEIPVRLPGLLSPKSSGTNKVVKGAGTGHALLPFIANEEVQKNLADFFGNTIDAMSEDFAGQTGVANLDFLRIKGDEAKTLPRTLKAVFGDRPTIEQIRANKSEGALGYSFFDPLHPDWRRDNDLKSMMKTVAKKGKRTSGTVRPEFEQYTDFLNELVSGLEKFYESGGKARSDMIASLGKGAAIYEELEPIVDQVSKQLQEYAGLLAKEKAIAEDEVWGDDRTPKQAHKDRQRIERLRSQYGDDPKALLKLLQVSQMDSEAVYQAKVEQILESRKPVPATIPEVVRDLPEHVSVNAGGAIEQGQKKGVIEKAKAVIAQRAQDDIERIKESIVNTVIDRINDKLMRVPGQPNVLDPSRQIGSIDELQGMDYLKAARVDMEDTLRTLLIAASKGYSVAKGGENMLMGAVPPLAVLKALAQRIGLPIAAFTAAGALPGVGAAEHALTGMSEGLLALPAEQLATAMSGAFADAVGTTIANIPLIGGKLAPAMTETITQLLLNAAGGAAEIGAEVITPIVGGQIMLGAAGTAAKSIMPALPEASVESNKQLQAATERQIKILGRAIETAKALLPINPEKAQGYIAGVKKDYPQISGQIDTAIAQLPAADRMREESGGAELARLKAEFTRTKIALAKAEERANKLGQIVAGWADIIQNPLEAMQRQVQGIENILDAEIIESEPQSQLLALPDAKSRMQEQFNQIVSASAAQIRDLGEEFSRQSQSLKSSKLSPEIKAEVAAAINASTIAARKAIDDLLAPFGSHVPQEITKAARSTRQRITKAEKSAQGNIAQAKSSGMAIPEGINAGIDSRLTELRQTAEAMAEVVISATENKLEIKSPSRVFQAIGQMVIKGFQMGLQGMSQATQFVDDFLQKIEQRFNIAKGTFADFANVIKIALTGFTAFKIFQALSGQISQMTEDIRESALEFSRFERIMKFVSGSSQKAQESLAAIAVESNKLGVDLRAAIEGQSDLMAAARDTLLEGDPTKQIASASREAAVVLSLSKEEVGRMNRAFAQMISKGKIQSEELRQQLGDVLPGSTSIAARAMGVSSAELSALLKNGELGIDSLIKFSQQLQLEMGSGVTDAAGSAQASMNRFGNAIYQIQVALGKQMLPAQSLGLDVLTTVLNAMPGLISTVSKLLVGFATYSLARIAIESLKASSGVNIFKISLSSIPKAIKGVVVAMAPLAAKLLLFAAISDAITNFTLRNGDAAEASKDFAESANKGLQEYLELMGQANNKTAQLANQLKTLPKSYAEDTLFGGAVKLFMGEDAGTKYLREREQDIAMSDPRIGKRSWLTTIMGGEQSVVTDFARLFGYRTANSNQVGVNPYFQTRADKTAQNILSESQSGSSAARTMMQNMNDMLASHRQGVGGLMRLRSIDSEMRDLASRKALTPASDASARKAIDTRFQELTKQREELSKQVNFLPTQIKRAIEGYKATNEEIKDALAKGGLSPATAKKLQDQLESNNKAIEDGEKLIQDFNSALNLTIETAKKLEFQFKQISLLQEAGQRAIEIQGTESMARVNALQLSGQITPGQAQSAQAISEQQQAVGNIANLGQTIDRLNALLSGAGVSRVLGMSGLQPGAGSVEINQKLMDLQLQGVDTDTEEFKILQQAQEAQAQVEQLKIQQAQAVQQLTQSQVQVQETVRQTTREINDFVRGIGRNIQEIGLTIEQLNLDTEVQQAKNDIQENLSGFSDRFFGEFISGIEEMVDLLNEPIKRMIDARQTAIQLQQQAQDAQTQASELQRNAMGGASGTGIGGNISVFGAGSVSAVANNVVQSALSWVGQDFAPGVREQCANFVRAVLEKAGVSIGVTNSPIDGLETGSALASSFFGQDIGAIIRDKSQVQPGDLLAFGGTYGGYSRDTITHVGVATGNGMMVDRSTSSAPVRQRSIDTFEGQNSGFLYAVRPHAYGAGSQMPHQAQLAAGGAIAPGGLTATNAFVQPNLDQITLATLSILESPTRRGRTDVAAAVANRLASGNYGSTVQEVAFAPGQFEPFFTRDRSQLQSIPDAVQILQEDRGMSEQAAREALSQFFSDLANPQIIQDSIAHVGGRTDFKGVSEYGNRVAAEDPLRSQGENFFHIGVGQTYAQLQQLQPQGAQILQQIAGAGLVDRGKGSQPNTTVNLSVPGADTSSINPALGALTIAHTQQMQSVYSQIEQQDRSTAIRLRQSFDKRKRELEDARQEIEDEARQYNERYQDLVLEAFGDTQLSQVLSRVTQVTRESEQNVRQQTLAIRDARVSLENLTELRDEIKSNPALEPLRQLLPEMDQTILTYQNKLDELEEAKDREEKILSERRDAILRNLRETQENAMRSIAASGENLSMQRQSLNIRDARLQGLLEARSQRAQVSQQYDEQLRSLNKELENTLRGIQRLELEGFKADSTELVVANEELANINAQITQLESNRGVELDIINQQSLDRLREYNREIGRSVVDAQVTQLGYRRDVFGANQLQRQSGMEQLNYDHAMRMGGIDSLQQQMIGQEGYDENMFVKMRQDAEALNNVSLQNLRMQFPDLADTLNQTAFAAFENLGNSMAGVLQGTKSLGDAFDEFFDSIINSLVQMATQWAASELFGLFFPDKKAGKAKGGSAGDIVGVASNVLSMIPGLDKGGLISGRYTGNPDQHIARVNPGEFIMSRRAVAAHGAGKLHAMNNLQKFDRGGFVGSRTEGRKYRDHGESRMDGGGSGGRDRKVKVEYSVTEINSVRYVTEDQFQQGLQQTSQATEDRMRRSIRSRPSYRDDLGMR